MLDGTIYISGLVFANIVDGEIQTIGQYFSSGDRDDRVIEITLEQFDMLVELYAR